MIIKTAKEILREMEVSINYGNETIDNYIVDTDEDHIVNAMIVYAQQFINLSIHQFKSSPNLGGVLRGLTEIKKQIQ